MKIIELLNKIANGEIKEGTKLKFANDIGIYCYEGQTMTIDVNDLNTEVEIIEEKQQQGRWKPKDGEDYWYIDDCGGVHSHIYFADDTDKFLYLTKNVFKTEKEAQEYLEYKTALLKAEKPFELYKKNFYICNGDGYLHLNYDTNFQSQGTIYLGTNKDVAQAFIDKWEKQILKYEFGIEE